MKRFALLFVVLPGIVGADTLVRTAEHPGFTRIVLDYENRPDYRVLDSDGSITVRSEEPVDYDLSDVYRRIGRSRVRTLSQTDEGLVIGLNCECRSKTVELPNGGLMIDIASISAPTSAVPLAQDRSVPPRNPKGGSAGISVEPRPGEAVKLSRNVVLPGILTRSSPDPSRRASGLRKALLESVVEKIDSSIVALPDAPDEIELDSEEVSTERDARDSQLTGQIVTDTRRGQNARGARRIPAIASCSPLLMQSAVDWLADIDTLGPAAGDDVVLRATVKKLIIRGFGAEALAVIGTLPSGSDVDLLKELARLIDAPIEAPNVSEMAECSDLSILFAALSDPPNVPARPGALVSALEVLPLEIRQVFGARIERQLKRIGQLETAQLVSSTFDRTPGQAGASRGRKVPGSFGADTGSKAVLANRIARRTPDAAVAMRDLILGYVDRSEPVPEATMEQARIVARETDGETRTDLDRSLVLARIEQGNIELAIESIDLMSARDPAVADALEQSLARAVLSTASDAGFLRRLSRIADMKITDHTLSVELARRAYDLGMPHLVEKVLKAHTGVSSRAASVLLARVYLDRQDWRKAALYLDRLTGDDIQVLRARIPAAVEPVEAESPATPRPESQTITSRGTDLVSRTAELRTEWESFLDQ